MLIAQNSIIASRCQYLPSFLYRRNPWITSQAPSAAQTVIVMLWAATKRVHRRTRFSKSSLGFLILFVGHLFNQTGTPRSAKHPTILPSCSCAAFKLRANRTIITFLPLTFAYPPSGLLRPFSSFEPEQTAERGSGKSLPLKSWNLLTFSTSAQNTASPTGVGWQILLSAASSRKQPAAHFLT